MTGSGHPAGVVLAAGAGTRLWPLTRLIPKALVPVGNVPLVDLAIARVGEALGLDRARPGPTGVAVNVHNGRELLEPHLSGRVHTSVEELEALGTAGALGHLHGWLDGRDVLVCNADAWLDVAGRDDVLAEPVGGHGSGGLPADFVSGWDRERVRVLCVEEPDRGDFGSLRYAGACLLPGRVAAGLAPRPAGLYEVCWRGEWDSGRLDVVVHPGAFIDCGTPADYLDANLAAAAAAGGSLVDPGAHLGPGSRLHRAVVGDRATVDGWLDESVVWPGATVAAPERLRRAVRAGGLTVLVR